MEPPVGRDTDGFKQALQTVMGMILGDDLAVTLQRNTCPASSAVHRKVSPPPFIEQVVFWFTVNRTSALFC